jgi:MOSC domain-containing protein YiiM
MPLRIRHLYVSPGHNYFGHHGRPAGAFATEEHETVTCVANKGIQGDRFFGYKQHYKGQVTLFSWEVFEKLRQELPAPSADPAALRRNVLVEGADLNDLIGTKFLLQGVMLEGTEECRPCYWMDQAIAPGAEVWLKGRGGLRCRVIAGGTLRRDL